MKIILLTFIIAVPFLTVHPQHKTWQIKLDNGAIHSGYSSFQLRGDSLALKKNDSLSVFAVSAITEIRFLHNSLFIERVKNGAIIGGVTLGVGVLLIAILNHWGESKEAHHTPGVPDGVVEESTGTRFLASFLVITSSALVGMLTGGIFGGVIDLLISQDDVYELSNHQLKVKRIVINQIIAENFGDK